MNQDCLVVLEELLRCEFLYICILLFHHITLDLLVVVSVCTSSGILVEQFDDRRIPDDTLPSLSDFGDVIVGEFRGIPVFVLELVESFVDILLVIVVLLFVDGGREGHVTLVLVLDPLLQSVVLLVDLQLVDLLRLQELLEVS